EPCTFQRLLRLVLDNLDKKK
ncbi:hypothetical protein CP082626L3_0810B, partial [Chlamydia psittaci 08-2626_L3]